MLITRPSLVQRLRHLENREAWEKFVSLYTPLLLHWARRQGANDPEDALQKLFVLLINKLPGFEYDANRSFRAWLKTILKHIVWKDREKKPGPLEKEIPTPDPLTDLEEAEARQHLLARTLALIKTDFEGTTWKSFWECVVNDRPAKEVSQELGISVGAVWTNVSRVRSRLREHFAGDLD